MPEEKVGGGRRTWMMYGDVVGAVRSTRREIRGEEACRIALTLYMEIGCSSWKSCIDSGPLEAGM